MFNKLMQNGKDYLVYISCSILTLIGIYNFQIRLLTQIEMQLKKFYSQNDFNNSILLFGGLGYVYFLFYILKNRQKEAYYLN